MGDSEQACQDIPSHDEGDYGQKKKDGVAAADDSKKLFVGGLSWETTEDNLRDYFEQFGTVDLVAIKVDRFTCQSRGFGFVVFEDEDTIDSVLSINEHRLHNKRIDPKRARPSRDVQKKVFVGGLDPDVTEDQIREYFGRFGKIETLEMPFDNQKGKRKAYIFITYSDENEAKEASKKEKQEIFGKRCDVRIAVPQDQANRRRWGSQAPPYGNNMGGYGGGVGYNYGYQGSYNNYGGYNQYGGFYGGGGGFQQQQRQPVSGVGHEYTGGFGGGFNQQPSVAVPNTDQSSGQFVRYGGGKIRGRGGVTTNVAGGAIGNFHPYNRQT